LKALGRALDNGREFSRPEGLYRMLGLPMCFSTRTNKFINVNEPKNRDGLLRPNIADMEDDDNPFFNSIYDYYVNRPDCLNKLTLAEFARDYDHVQGSKSDKVVEELETIPDDRQSGHIGPTMWLKDKKLGRIRKRRRQCVVRYHIDRFRETERMRGSRLLFTPFRNETLEIHAHPNKSIEELFKDKEVHIDNIRCEFEKNRDVLERIQKRMDDFENNDDNSDGENDDKSDLDLPSSQDETTSKDDLDHFLQLSKKKISGNE